MLGIAQVPPGAPKPVAPKMEPAGPPDLRPQTMRSAVTTAAGLGSIIALGFASPGPAFSSMVCHNCASSMNGDMRVCYSHGGSLTSIACVGADDEVWSGIDLWVSNGAPQGFVRLASHHDSVANKVPPCTLQHYCAEHAGLGRAASAAQSLDVCHERHLRCV